MRVGLGAGVLLVTALACGGGEAGTSELVVSAASSLTDVFSKIEVEFELGHPRVDVVLNMGASSSLREQILGGAPVDVFASANPDLMAEISNAGFVLGDAEIFAHNQLVIAVPKGNPGDVDGLDDFSRESLLIGLCAAQVPCGEFARDALEAAAVQPSIDSDEPNVRALLFKLDSAELDAGIVYQSDLSSSSDVEGISIPEKYNVSTEYVIGVLSGASQQQAASDFVAFVLSGRGRDILIQHGFEVP